MLRHLGSRQGSDQAVGAQLWHPKRLGASPTCTAIQTTERSLYPATADLPRYVSVHRTLVLYCRHRRLTPSELPGRGAFAMVTASGGRDHVFINYASEDALLAEWLT